MASTSPIEWTDATWNPVTGCTKISTGCKHCYAERMSLRLQAMGQPRYSEGFAVRVHSDLIAVPHSWSRPRIIFVNSMSDLFHEDVPFSFIERVFSTVLSCPQHVFQILTKRSLRLRELAPDLPWPTNLWIGVTVEDRSAKHRIADLVSVPATVRFLSCEPLLGPLGQLALSKIDWVIVGGESGPGARPMERPWVEQILNQCERARVPFFFKQWGGVRKARAGRQLNGRTYDELPATQVRPQPSMSKPTRLPEHWSDERRSTQEPKGTALRPQSTLR